MQATEFFKPESFLSLASCSLMVFIVTNTINYLFNFNPKYIGFIFCIIIGFVSTFLVNNLSILNIIIALVNSCLLFCTTIGLVKIGSKISKKEETDEVFSATLKSSKNNFFDDWF
jgi:uncharacterized membrane protein